jgi:hypothetical protein
LTDIVSKKIQYSADYSITSAGNTQVVTEVFDLPKFVMITKTTHGDTRSIFDGTNYVVCSENLGSWTCYKMNVQQSTQTEDVSNKVKQGADIKEMGTCSRAGESGKKYEITNNQIITTVCYTNDGIMLETESSGMTMYATKVSRSIDTSLFVPPATPKDMSSMIPSS